MGPGLKTGVSLVLFVGGVVGPKVQHTEAYVSQD